MEDLKVRKTIFTIDILKNSNLELVIYGDGSLKKELINYARKNGVALEIMDPLENEKLKNIYSKYKVYLSTSAYEEIQKLYLKQ